MVGGAGTSAFAATIRRLRTARRRKNTLRRTAIASICTSRPCRNCLQTPTFRSSLSKPRKACLRWSRGRNGKAASCCPLGLGGCWGWMGRVGIKDTATGERVPEHGAIPDLYICRNGRKTYVLLDANCVNHPQVQAARSALVRQLRKQGADVTVLNLPASKNGKEWNGPDDYVATCGDQYPKGDCARTYPQNALQHRGDWL